MAMAKDTSGLDILVVPLFYSFRGRFKNTYPPINLEVSTLGGYEAIPFGIRTLFDLHPDWAVM
jgi:hypothetical protein